MNSTYRCCSCVTPQEYSLVNIIIYPVKSGWRSKHGRSKYVPIYRSIGLLKNFESL